MVVRVQSCDAPSLSFCGGRVTFDVLKTGCRLQTALHVRLLEAYRPVGIGVPSRLRGGRPDGVISWSD